MNRALFTLAAALVLSALIVSTPDRREHNRLRESCLALFDASYSYESITIREQRWLVISANRSYPGCRLFLSELLNSRTIQDEPEPVALTPAELREKHLADRREVFLDDIFQTEREEK